MGNYVTEPEEARFYGTQLFDLVGSGKLKLKIFKEYEFSAEVRASIT
jgi:NADPH2:quinone reductase